MKSLLGRIAARAGRHVVRRASSNPWLQERAWELITARSSLRPGQPADFLAFCATNATRSRAQLCQDLWVLWETHSKRGGYFVEFGATNGVKLSNTWLLEKAFGWDGILAEPFPLWHDELATSRAARIDHRCVWKESGQQLEFVAIPDMPEYAGLSVRARAELQVNARARGVAPERVRTVSLHDLLREHAAPAHIDYLSIDTEGSELDILEAFDFGCWRIDLISVEHAFDRDKRAALCALLECNGFTRRLQSFSRWDDWYVSRALLAERG